MLPGMELRAWPPLLTEVPIIDRTKGGCSHCDVTHWFVKSYLQAQDVYLKTNYATKIRLPGKYNQPSK